MLPVLWSGCDTLEVTFDGELQESFVQKLEFGRASALALHEPQPVLLADIEFMLQPNGARLWSWVLRGEDMIMWLRESGVPKAKVRVLSHALVALGLEGAWEKVRAVTASLGLVPLGVSRIDVACDFHGWVP